MLKTSIKSLIKISFTYFCKESIRIVFEIQYICLYIIFYPVSFILINQYKCLNDFQNANIYNATRIRKEIKV